MGSCLNWNTEFLTESQRNITGTGEAKAGGQVKFLPASAKHQRTIPQLAMRKICSQLAHNCWVWRAPTIGWSGGKVQLLDENTALMSKTAKRRHDEWGKAYLSFFLLRWRPWYQKHASFHCITILHLWPGDILFDGGRVLCQRYLSVEVHWVQIIW